VQTWFSFLLQHGVRPYQSVLIDQIHDQNLGFYLTSEKSGMKFDAKGNPIIFRGRPIYWGEDDFLKHYFTNSYKIYSDKISKFVCNADKASQGEVISRISRIYQHIFIDEVQDLAGYDLDVIKLLFNAETSVLLVGDPRQVTYLTHHSTKHGKYADGKIKAFVESELGSKIKCEIDEVTLSVSHRNNQLICDYSARLYPNLPVPKSCECDGCRIVDGHLGVFIIKPSQVDRYLQTYNPVQLRWSASSKVHSKYAVLNFGESKGATMDRVLIYPTKPITEWIKNNANHLTAEGRSKFYVGLTRSRLSSTIVVDYKEGQSFDGATLFTFNDE
jgi:DNA helicase-2/ATP-dependent DNA helicase PcrA